MTDDELRQRVGARLRRLADRLATDDLDQGEWGEIDGLLGQAEAAFGDPPPVDTRFARAHRGSPTEALEDPLDDPSSVHPLATGSSGIYPPLALTFDDDRLVARVEFGPAWEGPPDLVHGGFLAAGFDIVLSALAHHAVGVSVTRHLRVRYLKPTLLANELRYEAVVAKREGRLVDLRATLYADERVTARASAQFAALSADRFADRRPT